MEREVGEVSRIGRFQLDGRVLAVRIVRGRGEVPDVRDCHPLRPLVGPGAGGRVPLDPADAG